MFLDPTISRKAATICDAFPVARLAGSLEETLLFAILFFFPAEDQMRADYIAARDIDHFLARKLDPDHIVLRDSPEQSLDSLPVLPIGVMRFDRDFTPAETLPVTSLDQRPLEPRRRDFEYVGLADVGPLLQVMLDRAAHPRAILDRHAFARLGPRPIDAQPQDWPRPGAAPLQINQLVSERGHLGIEIASQLFVALHIPAIPCAPTPHTNKKWGCVPHFFRSQPRFPTRSSAPNEYKSRFQVGQLVTPLIRSRRRARARACARRAGMGAERLSASPSSNRLSLSGHRHGHGHVYGNGFTSPLFPRSSSRLPRLSTTAR